MKSNRIALIPAIVIFCMLLVTVATLEAQRSTGYPITLNWNIEKVPVDNTVPQFGSTSSQVKDSNGMLHVARWVRGTNLEPLSTLEYIYWDGVTTTTKLVYQSNEENVWIAQIGLDENEMPLIGYGTIISDGYRLRFASLDETSTIPSLVSEISHWSGWQFIIAPDTGPFFAYTLDGAFYAAQAASSVWTKEQLLPACDSNYLYEAILGVDMQNRLNIMSACPYSDELNHLTFDTGTWQNVKIQNLPLPIRAIAQLNFLDVNSTAVVYVAEETGLATDVPVIALKTGDDIDFQVVRLPHVASAKSIQSGNIRFVVDSEGDYHLVVVRGEFSGGNDGFDSNSLYYYAEFDGLPYTTLITRSQSFGLVDALTLDEDGLPIQTFYDGTLQRWQLSVDSVEFVDLNSRIYLPVVFR